MRPVRLLMRAFGPYPDVQALDFRELGHRSFFLIHGPTGAGKTSILDAITFALYGDTSGDERRASEMRSDFADPSIETEVTFDFAVGPERYRVWRRPRQERPAKRGGGTVKLLPDAGLWCTTGCADAQVGRVLASGIRDVDSAVTELLGFQSGQFRQVVVLPQGRFREVLSSDVKKREDILRHLFRTDRYADIERFLKTKRDELKQGLVGCDSRAAGILSGVGVDDRLELDARMAHALSELHAEEERRVQVEEEEEGARRSLEAGRAADAALRELNDAATALAALQGRAKEIEATRGELEAAKRARLVVESRNRLEDVRSDVARTQATREQALMTLQAAVDRDTTCRAALTAEDERAPDRAAAQQSVRDLRAVADRLSGLTEAVARHRAAGDALKGATDAYDAACGLVTAAERSASVAEGLARLQPQARDARRLADERRRLDHLEGESATSRAALQAAVRKEEALQEELQRTRALAHRIEADWRSGQAGRLAGLLEPGSPCPVCGSNEHPAPARSREDAPDDEELRLVRDSVEQAQRAATSGIAERAAAEVVAESAARRAGEVSQGLGLWAARSAQEVEEEAVALESRVMGLEAECEQLSAPRLAEECRAERDRLREGWEELKRDLAGLAATVAEREHGVPEALRPPGALEAALEAALRHEAALEAALLAVHQAVTQAGVALAGARTAFEGADHAHAEAVRRAVDAENALDQALAAHGFSGRAAFDAAVRVEAEIEALAGALAAYGQETAAATTRHERAQALAVGAAPPDLAGLEAAVIIAAAACDEATEARARATAAVEGYRTAAAAHDAVMAETAALQRRFGLVGRLADVAGGDNPLKLSFQRYVLGRFLDEVLEHASFRLLHMSRGRFRLQRASGIVDGRRAGGLDLEVFDEQTATLRPVSTLSGGEGFLASLALSLSLADVVQAHAGGLRLETMFVDEGFGTLDPEALDAAIETLIQLAGAAGDGAAGRLVGVISHVPELRERIDARLEVIPGPRGSTARFVVA